MRARWLQGVSLGALVALAAAVSVLPAASEPTQAAIEAAVPIPEPADVPPPSVADIAPAAASFHATHEAPASTGSVSTEQPEQDALPPATSAAAAPPTDEASIARAVPIPEPADVSPPTMADNGRLQLAPADQAVADQLQALIAKRVDRLIEGKKQQNAVAEFYKARGYAPVWIEQGAPSPRMQAAIARLRLADADGLDASDYAAPELAALTDPESVAQAELKLLNALLTFARHAQSGRVDATRISVNIDVKPPVPEPTDVLKTLAQAKDVAAAMDAFNPPHEGFRLLRAKLAEMRGQPEERIVQIPPGPALRAGRKDKRVPLLRQRLKVDGDPEDTTYDAALVDAVKAFQKSRNIAANGILTPATVEALNGRNNRSRHINTVLSNMERWRWIPRDLGQSHVMINVPDFTLKVVRDGEPVFHTRIVVGKPKTPSPIFSDQIETIQVNPTWHVPQSIIYGEYLPALAQDPEALARMGLILSRNRDGSISVRQPPGERNALGRIKFNFPNAFQVYLHDTPQKHLFTHDRRAYSAGCMRVQNPDKFAEVLASISMPGEGYTSQRFTRMYGGGEQWIKFKRFVPVHLVYMNAYVDQRGELIVREDVYGYDGRVQSALNGRYVVVAERSQKVTPGRPPVGAGYASNRRAPPPRPEPAPSSWFSWRQAAPAPAPQDRARRGRSRGQVAQPYQSYPDYQYYRDRAGL